MFYKATNDLNLTKHTIVLITFPLVLFSFCFSNISECSLIKMSVRYVHCQSNYVTYKDQKM